MSLLDRYREFLHGDLAKIIGAIAANTQTTLGYVLGLEHRLFQVNADLEQLKADKMYVHGLAQVAQDRQESILSDLVQTLSRIAESLEGRERRAEDSAGAAVQELARCQERLMVVAGLGFREFEAVDYAVDKLEADRDLDAWEPDKRVSEAMSWARKYANANSWAVPDEQRLRELVVWKMRLNQDRRVGRHG